MSLTASKPKRLGNMQKVLSVADRQNFRKQGHINVPDFFPIRLMYLNVAWMEFV